MVTPSEHLRERIFVALVAEAPTWEEEFAGGPGHVVGVSDAATVAARECDRWLRRLQGFALAGTAWQDGTVSHSCGHLEYVDTLADALRWADQHDCPR